MGIFDIFKINKFRMEIAELKQENANLTSMLRPEHIQIIDLTTTIQKLKLEQEQLQIRLNQLGYEHDNNIRNFNQQLTNINLEIANKQSQLIDLDEQHLLQSFALYEPKFEFSNSTKYKSEIDHIRNEQKRLIKEGTACTGNMNWTVNNSSAQGKKMVSDMIKLLLRSFNNECDACVANVKFNNIHTFEKRIESAFSTINKLGTIMNISITEQYKKLKMYELFLSHEYQLKKQEEKEEQRRIREQMREEAKLQRELEEARKTVEKEKRHYTNALQKVLEQLDSVTDDSERELLQSKITDLQGNLVEINKQFEDIDYREANQRAGYVYIISNIGSFGENVYKIGMTRRLDPYDRIYELGDASVPFNFDVHAMIFSDDAPTLENTLHKEFENRRINLINRRREYFYVTLNEIEDIIKKYHDNTVEFIFTAAAEEYRESALVRNQQNAAIQEIETSMLQAAATNFK